MNTHLYSTKKHKSHVDNIEYMAYKNISEIIDALRQASALSHEDYESVKLYGDSEFILSALRCIISNKKYSDIVIASIDITSSNIDLNCKDDYVLTLYDDELYIQSAWNGNSLYMNDAKFTICQSEVPEHIFFNILKSKTPVKICDFSN